MPPPPPHPTPTHAQVLLASLPYFTFTATAAFDGPETRASLNTMASTTPLFVPSLRVCGLALLHAHARPFPVWLLASLVPLVLVRCGVSGLPERSPASL